MPSKLSSRRLVRARWRLLVCCAVCLPAISWYTNNRFGWKLIVEQESDVARWFPDEMQEGFVGTLYRILRRLVHVLPEQDAARLHLDRRNPCKQVLRLGHSGDGGWDVCADQLQPYGSNGATGCVVYSFGINDDISFDEAIVERFPGCTVFAFDPSIGRQTGQDFGPKIKFYNQGLGAVNSNTLGSAGSSHPGKRWNIQTLESTMLMLGHSKLDVLKMDIESDEWEVFASWMRADHYVRPFNQLLGELHFGDPALDQQRVQLLAELATTGISVFSRKANWRYSRIRPINSTIGPPVTTNTCLEVGWAMKSSGAA